MKRLKIRRIILALAVLFSVSGCTVKETKNSSKEGHENKIFIQKAKLNDTEQSIIDLLGVDSHYVIYDFKVDHQVKAIQVNTYELRDGKWEIVAGKGGKHFTDSSGRIAFSFENIGEGYRTAIQSENTNGSNTYIIEVSEEDKNMGRMTSYLENKEIIEYEKEIPLVMQTLTHKNEVVSCNVEDFYEPSEYSQYGYEHVYAITIKFSQKTVSELD
ncbi:MAG: hypothetical protein E7231_17875 [Cellulosilyticum sp.]|nr:hypothetical protein [Cellulosilyticum sp.]